MNNFTFIFIGFFLFHGYGFANGFDYRMIAQTWPPGLCHEKSCIPEKATLMKFTIHGLWPSSNSIRLENCGGNQILPQVRL